MRGHLQYLSRGSVPHYPIVHNPCYRKLDFIGKFSSNHNRATFFFRRKVALLARWNPEAEVVRLVLFASPSNRGP
jgi:hypothetical protein